MTNFSEANVNLYLSSIKSNLVALQSFATDMETNFVNCFQTRFIMTQHDIDKLNSWPSVLKSELSLFTRMTVNYYAVYQSMNLILEIEGFESPIPPPVALPPFPDNVKVKVEGNLDYTPATGDINYKAKIKVEASWSICD
jgi:hypothetical protein